MRWRTLLPWWRIGPPAPPSRVIVLGVLAGAGGAYFHEWMFVFVGALSVLTGVIELWRARRRH